MKTFKIGSPIVLGIYKESSLFNQIDEKDFKLYYASALNPTKETELNVKVVNDDPYWWSSPFYLFKVGDFIIHWVNDNGNIDVKEMIRLELPDTDDDNGNIML